MESSRQVMVATMFHCPMVGLEEEDRMIGMLLAGSGVVVRIHGRFQIDRTQMGPHGLQSQFNGCLIYVHSLVFCSVFNLLGHN